MSSEVALAWPDGLDIELALPAGFHIACIPILPADDRHACGRAAAQLALLALGEDPARLAYDGTRPVVALRADHADSTRDPISVSITHGGRAALAVAARVSRLGIDLCDDDPRLPGLAERFLVEERGLARSPLDLSACFAAKEAALKALGRGILDGGILDGTAVRVVSLAPPRLSRSDLQLALGRVAGGAVAVVYG